MGLEKTEIYPDKERASELIASALKGVVDLNESRPYIAHSKKPTTRGIAPAVDFVINRGTLDGKDFTRANFWTDYDEIVAGIKALLKEHLPEALEIKPLTRGQRNEP